MLKDGSDPRYHLGWGIAPALPPPEQARARARPDDGGLIRPALSSSPAGPSSGPRHHGSGRVASDKRRSSFGGNSGGAFGACPPSSLHSPRLAGGPARRVLLHRRRRSLFDCAITLAYRRANVNPSTDLHQCRRSSPRPSAHTAALAQPSARPRDCATAMELITIALYRPLLPRL